MATSRLLRPANQCLRTPRRTLPRTYSTSSPTTPHTSPFAPRHLLSIADLTPHELTTLIRTAATQKQSIKSGHVPPALTNALLGQTIALLFTKRSTRTRVSTEAAVALLQGHPMFLGSQDIQLGVNESLHDTSVVISSMVSAVVARVDAHEDVVGLAKHSSVPVINALSDAFHPLQTIADFLTIHEAFPSTSKGSPASKSETSDGLGLEGLKIAWIGDANNVLFDLALGAAKLGVQLSVATPKGYEIPSHMRELITSASPTTFLTETNVPEEAVKDADILVTDTWISMGQESSKAQKMSDFAGFQITKELAQRGGAKQGWRFMHCLPRKPEEVSDEVFYSPASLVFQEAENRLWAVLAVLEAFVVKKGKIV
ncbi:Ornithine carbamoyltransferase, mitochondrial [Friedmanniomyces endolithicus]|uniref:Ornithine carbamoyltransferase, mitochondrial n=1 Tax=Friedmanniomyces endolithicus TaxID=329885 RepID=A0A4U0VHA2_9PEZI|nr:Ornithine carbamoyltransferase, mitochondrial [Friedmanniomyces endolithicus]